MVRLVVVGAGSRGFALAAYARHHPERARVVAVAEPREAYREAFRREFGVPRERAFSDWRGLLELPLLGEAAIVALPDRLHAEAATALLRKGYHLLLEKPIASTWEEVEGVAQAARATGRMVAVAHVLRYTPYARSSRPCWGRGSSGRWFRCSTWSPWGTGTTPTPLCGATGEGRRSPVLFFWRRACTIWTGSFSCFLGR